MKCEYPIGGVQPDGLPRLCRREFGFGWKIGSGMNLCPTHYDLMQWEEISTTIARSKAELDEITRETEATVKSLARLRGFMIGSATVMVILSLLRLALT